MAAPRLADDVIVLQAITRDDAEEIFAVLSTEPDIARWTRIPWPYTRAHLRDYMDAIVQWTLGGADHSWTIRSVETGEFLGCIGLHRVGAPPRHRSAFLPDEVGYWLTEPARGRGYASRAVRLVCGFAIDEIGRPSVNLQVKVGNAASQRVALACGFRHLGTVSAAEVDDDDVDHERYVLESPRNPARRRRLNPFAS